MKLYAPEYYKEFTCIADRCKHSCCVGWEIDVDDAAMKKYAEYKGNYSDKITESIENNAEPHFKLDWGERCPHLNEKGLCNIILNVGEDYLCHICREHPRFYNDTPRGREVGLGLACEEACRIILDSDNYDKIVEIDDIDGESCDEYFDTIRHREVIYGVLCDKLMPYQERLDAIYSQYGVTPKFISDSEARKLLESLEYLDTSHKELFSLYSSDSEFLREGEKQLERALAYFIYRHCTEAWDERDFRVSLAFCFFCERLLTSVAKKCDMYDAARIISEEIEYSEDNTEAIKNFFDLRIQSLKTLRRKP